MARICVRVLWDLKALIARKTSTNVEKAAVLASMGALASIHLDRSNAIVPLDSLARDVKSTLMSATPIRVSMTARV